MNKTLRKQTPKLKFDTSRENLKCFIGRAQQKGRQSALAGYSSSSSTQKQADSMLSCVVSSLFSDAKDEQISRLIKSMNFCSNAPQACEQIDDLSIQQLFTSTLQTPQSWIPKPTPLTAPLNPQSELNSYYTYLYFQSPLSRQLQKRKTGNSQSTEFLIVPQQIEIDGRTTLMVRHIPNKYTEQTLIEELSMGHKSRINFLYLPIDQWNQCNVGYAFVNFVSPKFITEFYTFFNGRKWDRFNSEKRCQLAYARIQGASSLLNHFQNALNNRGDGINPQAEERKPSSKALHSL